MGRNSFFGLFSGSISTALTTGMPDSFRPSLPVKQPVRQNFVHVRLAEDQHPVQALATHRATNS
jgi:hypothetical protein